jgi:hypothetical protein
VCPVEAASNERMVSLSLFLVLLLLQVDLKHIHSSENLVEMGMNLKDYYPSGEWDILSVPAERHARVYECCPGEFFAGQQQRLLFLFFSFIKDKNILLDELFKALMPLLLHLSTRRD